MRVRLKSESRPQNPKEDQTMDPSKLESLPVSEPPSSRSGVSEGEQQPEERVEEEEHVWETLIPEDRAHGMLLDWVKALKVLPRVDGFTRKLVHTY